MEECREILGEYFATTQGPDGGWPWTGTLQTLFGLFEGS